MDQEIWRKLVSGQGKGFADAFLLVFLRACSKLYGCVINVRNVLYTTGLFRVHRVKSTVISIGNITTGGTGKTPMVIWLYNYLMEKHASSESDYPIVILTRGYKAVDSKDSRDGKCLDEPAALGQLCPNAKVIINADRVAGAKQAVEEFNTKIIITDDCFQHRRLARDVDIVMIDVTQPFGILRSSLSRLGALEKGRLLPAGFLREPLEGLKRADAVILTRSDQVGSLELKQIKGNLIAENPTMVIANSVHAPVSAKMLDGKEVSLEELSNKKIFGFCGIGNPHAFFDTIKKVGAKVVGSRIFDDHYHYSEADIKLIFKEARERNAEMVLTTHKDWTKTAFLKTHENDISFGYLQVEIKIISNEDEITELIDKAIEGKIAD